MSTKNDKHFEFLKKAFANDGFNVKNFKEDPRYKDLSYVTAKGYMEYQGKIGILAEHSRAFNIMTGKPKPAYYVEGTHFQMGAGSPNPRRHFVPSPGALICAPRIPVISWVPRKRLFFFTSFYSSPDGFTDTEAPSLMGWGRRPPFVDKIKDLLVSVIGDASQAKIGPDVPIEYQLEMEGIYQGCKALDPALGSDSRKKKFMEKLWAINFGIDLLLAHIYTGEVFTKEKVPAFLLKVPILCNAFSICGEVTAEGKHFFGRDFMFPTANVFQNTACLIIYNPEAEGGKTFLPIVSQTAPGLIGSIAAMNSEGVAMGVDMSPGKLCNPSRPGLNSLVLNRESVERCSYIEELVVHMINAPRGVSWLYPAADGKSGKACVIEAGCNPGDQPFPYFDYLPGVYRKNLGGLTIDYINRMREKYGTPAPQKGLIPRWGDYNYPVDYIADFNEKMWKIFYSDFFKKFENSLTEIIGGIASLVSNPKTLEVVKSLLKQVLDLFKRVPYDLDRFNRRGYLCDTWKAKVCPGPFYFAPQRDIYNELALVSNHCITPEMRLTAMNDWVAVVTAGNLNDIQWRYDEINHEIQQAVERAKDVKNPRLITAGEAWRIIDFLSPAPGYDFPTYYNPNGESWKTRVVHGSVSLLELKERKIKSLFGYHGDEAVEITLPN